jgi:hypothetical protein
MASALLGVSDVITIPAFPGLEQLFTKLRIAACASLLAVAGQAKNADAAVVSDEPLKQIRPKF